MMKRDQRRRNAAAQRSGTVRGCLLIAGASLLGVMPLTLTASAPVKPLDPPLYSFDSASPSNQDGIFGPADMLALGHPKPFVSISGAALGLVDADDDLDSLSTDSPDLAPGTTFVLLFSVDRASVGVALPDDAQLGRLIPYNMLDQAQRGQAAGDQYMTLDLYDRNGHAQGTSGGARVSSNNSLDRNQYDEGGTDFSAKPEVSASESVARAAQDNVNATAEFPPNAASSGEPLNVFFSAATGSPSLADLPGSPSGANIYYNQDAIGSGSVTTLFGQYSDFGLVQGDDIDAMIVIDDNVADGGLFDASVDKVLFSLAPDSPSLSTIVGASAVGAAADIFRTVNGGPPVVVASAQDLGLGDSNDNVDALDYLLCTDAVTCARERSIRMIEPIPAVSAWGLVSMLLLALAVGTIVFRRARACC